MLVVKVEAIAVVVLRLVNWGVEWVLEVHVGGVVVSKQRLVGPLGFKVVILVWGLIWS